jgi:acyl carrier protein
MQSTAALSSDSADALLRHFPREVREAYVQVRDHGDAGAADTLVMAILLDHIPDEKMRPADGPSESMRLVADLGFDSVAIAEMVFFIEDLLHVSIRNEEILRVHTVGDLRAFVRTKLAGRPGGVSPAPCA